MEPDMDLLGAIWSDWDGVAPAPVVEAENSEAEARVAEFEQMMSAADVASIENDTSILRHAGRLHAGQFHRRVKEWFGVELADLAYDALICNADFARQNAACWQALKQLESLHSMLYSAVASKMAWQRGGVTDLGPFGNDWGE